MCTAATYKTKDHYFGRTLDLECSFGESVVITPRNYPIKFRTKDAMTSHNAIIGMAIIIENHPLYYDATNEYGLSMAGLNFPQNAFYNEQMTDKDNIAPFEFIPWILGQCKDIAETRKLVEHINLVNINFSNEFPLTPLHWIIADKESAITVESMKDGLKIYDNPIGIMTNNPPFDIQMFNLNNYMSLSAKPPVNNFSDKLSLTKYSRGMGALGLPGDLSSASRFVKASFTKLNSVAGESESESVSQFFHILGSVEQQRGCVILDKGEYEITVYTSCCNTDKGIYYYTTYENNQISAVDMNREDLNGSSLISYSLIKGQQIKYQN
ncbi:MAG: choloylglycine hydrolase [Oscillospiraceae bacterium]